MSYKIDKGGKVMEENKKDIIEVEKIEENSKEENVEKKIDTSKDEPKVEVIKDKKEEDKKGFSIAALVLGIISIVFLLMWYISIPCGILAIIFGIIGIKSSKKGMSIAGLITGTIGVIISMIIFMAIICLGIFIGLTESFESIDSNSIYYDDFEKFFHDEINL